MYKLVISDDEGRTTVVPLVRDEITIGREDGNTIRLTERNVSRRHARLARAAEGRFVLEDLGSYNGIKVNGKRIGSETPLDAGDQIIIGDYRIALESEQTGLNSGELDISLSGAHDLVPPARLVMLSQPAPGAEFALSKDVVKIGRDEVMDVWVNHRSISREHAEIRRTVEGEDATEPGGEGDESGDPKVSFTILDLDSANGVRVNGEEVFEHVLEKGDVVELGQVRFRFVDVGEVFSFDSVETTGVAGYVDEEEEDEDEDSGLPVVVPVLILGIAIGLGAAIALSGGKRDEPDPAEQAPTTVAEQQEVVDAGPPPPSSEDIATATDALERCHDGLEAGDAAAAVAAAEEAVRLVPNLEGAEECRVYAALLVADDELFQQAQQQLEDGEVDSAYFTMEQLSTDSAHRESDEFARVTSQFARRHIDLAREALGQDSAEAASQAQMVLQTPGISRRTRTDAERVLNVANRRLAAAEAADTERRAAQDQAQTQNSGGSTASGNTTNGQTTATADPSQSPMDRARECMRAGDDACVIDALEGGGARSAASLALLIDSYRRTGNSDAARRNMRRFVEQYPQDRRAENYARALGASE